MQDEADALLSRIHINNDAAVNEECILCMNFDRPPSSKVKFVSNKSLTPLAKF